MLEQIFPFLIASIFLTLSPGPDIIYVLSQSLVGGYRRGLIIAAGLVTGIIVHTSLVAFGVSLVIKNSETLFWGIKIAGALYLFYLAYKVYISSRGEGFSSSEETEISKSSFSYYKTGLVMNMLNPKVTIFFLAFFPGFLGALFMLQAFLIFSVVSVLAGKVSTVLFQKSSHFSFLKWFQILTFIAIAILILL
jgi:threonine/homoserine/homoserine lactone efflux protein